MCDQKMQKAGTGALLSRLDAGILALILIAAVYYFVSLFRSCMPYLDRYVAYLK
mgnify:CR=1 FL=1|jgi:hypothetical protein